MSYVAKGTIADNSAFFRSMPMPSEAPPGGAAGDVIDIEGSSSVLAAILDVITASGPPDLTAVRWCGRRQRRVDILPEVIELGKRYQFDALPRLLAPHLHSHICSDPTTQFVFASQNDLESHARACILAFGQDSDWIDRNIADLPAADLEDAASSYVVALAKAMGANQKDDGMIDWPAAASAFAVHN